MSNIWASWRCWNFLTTWTVSLTWNHSTFEHHVIIMELSRILEETEQVVSSALSSVAGSLKAKNTLMARRRQFQQHRSKSAADMAAATDYLLHTRTQVIVCLWWQLGLHFRMYGSVFRHWLLSTPTPPPLQLPPTSLSPPRIHHFNLKSLYINAVNNK